MLAIATVGKKRADTCHRFPNRQSESAQIVRRVDIALSPQSQNVFR